MIKQLLYLPVIFLLNCAAPFQQFSAAAVPNSDIVLYKQISEDSTILAEFKHKSGLIIDTAVFYYKSGVISSKYIYTDRDDYTRYSYHRNGRLAHKNTCKKGTRIYDNDIYYDSLGNVVSKWIESTDDSVETYVVYGDNGKVRTETNVLNGKMHGERKEYSKEGTLESISIYIHGEVDTSRAAKDRTFSLNRRSAKSILMDVGKRLKDLRLSYNYYLQGKPFGGKVHIHFEINPKGDVVRLFTPLETTGNPAFVSTILNKVSRWKFSEIKGTGNDMVTIPFTFSD